MVQQRIDWKVLFIEKYFIPLMLIITVGSASAALAQWLAVRDLTNIVQSHEKRLTVVEADLVSMRTTNVTRSELLETLKRVEQQLEIVMLKAKINGKIKVVED